MAAGTAILEMKERALPLAMVVVGVDGWG